MLPELADVASDQQTAACSSSVDIDRELASRLSVLTQAIDDTLTTRSASAKSRSFSTQLNQYRVILEVEPHFSTDPESLRKDVCEISTGQMVP